MHLGWLNSEAFKLLKKTEPLFLGIHQQKHVFCLFKVTLQICNIAPLNESELQKKEFICYRAKRERLLLMVTPAPFFVSYGGSHWSASAAWSHSSSVGSLRLWHLSKRECSIARMI